MVRRQAEGLGDAVGGFEAHAVNIPRQAVGVAAHHAEGLVAVLLVDLDRQVGADAVAVQEEHDLFDLLLLIPGKGDQAGALGADIRHFAQALGLAFDHFEGLSAEMGHDALGQARADAPDQARA